MTACEGLVQFGKPGVSKALNAVREPCAGKARTHGSSGAAFPRGNVATLSCRHETYRPDWPIEVPDCHLKKASTSPTNLRNAVTGHLDTIFVSKHVYFLIKLPLSSACLSMANRSQRKLTETPDGKWRQVDPGGLVCENPRDDLAGGRRRRQSNVPMPERVDRVAELRRRADDGQ